MTKNTCYFTLHRVRNIDVHDVENSISGPLDFKMGMPPDPPRGSRLRHSDLITPLINIPVNTNTPLKTSATRHDNVSSLVKGQERSALKVSHSLIACNFLF